MRVRNERLKCWSAIGPARALFKAEERCYGCVSSRMFEGKVEEELCYVASEALFERKASEQSCARVGDRRRVFRSGGGRRSSRANGRIGSGSAVSESGTTSGRHSRRRRNL